MAMVDFEGRQRPQRARPVGPIEAPTGTWGSPTTPPKDAGTGINPIPTDLNRSMHQPAAASSPAPSAAPSSSGYDWGAIEKQLRDAAQQRGLAYDASDLEGVQRHAGYDANAGRNVQDFVNSQISIYNQRAGDGGRLRNDQVGVAPGGAVPQQLAQSYYQNFLNAGGGSGGSGGFPSGPPMSGIPNMNQFTDPITGPVANMANELANRFANPPSGSGAQLLEEALRNLAAQFQSGGYTPAEMEQFQTQTFDPTERLRAARKQQVMQQLSSRGLSPNDGIGLSMLADVDRQFDAMRAQQQTQLGTQAANQRSGRQLSSVELLNALSGQETGRLNQAYQYATVPVGLADRAFNQASQFYGMAGNPVSMFNPAMQMAQMGQNQQAQLGNGLAQLAWMLMNGGGG